MIARKTAVKYADKLEQFLKRSTDDFCRINCPLVDRPEIPDSKVCDCCNNYDLMVLHAELGNKGFLIESTISDADYEDK
jgi:hypothetical protein